MTWTQALTSAFLNVHLDILCRCLELNSLEKKLLQEEKI
jgi:hypothetical protein